VISSDALTAALRAAPELQQSPGTAVALAQTSQTPTADAQAAGMGLNAQAYAAAANNYQQSTGSPPPHRGLFGDLFAAAGQAIHDVQNDVVKPIERQRIPGTNIRPGGAMLQGAAAITPGVGQVGQQALQLANMPLQEVQHNYRYLADVWQRHGPIPAIAELAGIIGIGVGAGSLTDNAKLGVLGGEAAGAAEGQLFYRDSWRRTQNGSAYRDASGQLVSPGRTVANALGIAHSGAAHGIVSGAVDATFDMMLDPLQKVGGIYGEAKGTEGAITNPFTGNKVFVGTQAYKPGDAQFLQDAGRFQVGGYQYRRAAGWIADHSASEIAQRFPPLTEVPGLVDRLGEATTMQEVTNVYEDRLAFEQAMNEGRFVPEHILIPSIGVDVRPTVTNPITGEVTPYGNVTPAFATEGLPTESSFSALIKSSKTWAENLSQKARMFDMLPEQGKVSLVGDQGIEELRRQAMVGMPPRVATDLLDQFLATNNIEERKRIIKAVQTAVVLSRAGVRDEAAANPRVLQKVLESIDTAMGGEQLSHGVYDMNDKGDDISKILIKDADGNVVATATAAGHAGQLSTTSGLLGYGDVKDLSQQLKGWHGIYGAPGAADDFFWKNATSPWRRLALATGAFAAHITMAEDLLNGARQGFINLADQARVGLGERLGMRVASDEAGPVRSAVYWLMGSPHADEWDQMVGAVRRAMESGSPEEVAAAQRTAAELRDKLDLATFITYMTKGHQLDPAVSAGWVFPRSGEAPVETMQTAIDSHVGKLALDKGQIVGNGYQLYRGDDKNAAVWWGQHLNFFASDPADQVGAQAFRTAMAQGADKDQASLRAYQAIRDQMRTWSEADRQLWMRSTQSSIEGLDPMDALARHKVEALKGTLTGADGTFHVPLLTKIANGEPINWRDVADIAPASRPWNIPGREIINRPGGLLASIDRLAQLGHERLFSPIINAFGRQPTYFADVNDAYKLYKPMVDAGTLDEGVAKSQAMQDAARKMIRFIHNPEERLQFTETMRNVAPFWFAQVQAYKRFGRLLLEDPGAFRKAQLILTAMTNLANRQQDAGGNQQVVYPGSGWITDGMLRIIGGLGGSFSSAVPVSFAGSTSSMSAIDPFMQGTSGFRPSVGPLVAIAAKAIDNLDPHAASVVASAVGAQTATESYWNLIPNTPIRDAILGVAPPIPGLVVGNDSIWMHTIANLDYAQNVALDKWYQTQQYKDFIAAGGDPNSPEAYAAGRPDIVPAPESPDVVQSAVNVSAHQKLVDSVKTQSRWVRFVQAIMSEVTPASPQPLIGNQKIPAEFQQLVKSEGLNKAYVDFAIKYPDGAPLIQAMSDVAGSGVLAASKEAQRWIDAHQGFVNLHPEIASFFVPQQSADTYSPAAYNEQIAMGLRHRKTPTEFQNDFYVNSGWTEYDANHEVYKNDLANGANPTSERAAWDQWLAGFKAQHPTWAAMFDNQNQSIAAQQQLNTLRLVLDTGQHPASPQVDVLKNLMEQYDRYASMLLPGANGLLNPLTSVNLPVQQAWEQWLKDTATSNPEYAPAINKIFRWLVPVTPAQQAA
jgi:hypothetical protein